MTAGPTGTEDSGIVEAINRLNANVMNLHKTLAKDYPKRTELEKYSTTQESRRRILGFFATAMVAVLVAQMLTISTISYCFLGGPNSNHTICRAIPGYTRTTEQGNDRLRQFEELLMQIPRNRDEIADLNKRVAELEKQLAENN